MMAYVLVFDRIKYYLTINKNFDRIPYFLTYHESSLKMRYYSILAMT